MLRICPGYGMADGSGPVARAGALRRPRGGNQRPIIFPEAVLGVSVQATGLQALMNKRSASRENFYAKSSPLLAITFLYHQNDFLRLRASVP